MKVKFSFNWVKSYFLEPLSEPEMIMDGLLKHAFEVESAGWVGNDFVFELDILANRQDCLSHYGIAKEIGIIFNTPLSENIYDDSLKVLFDKNEEGLSINLNTKKCRLYTLTKINDCTNPALLKNISERLNAIGQKSINPIVDISNYILFDTGQPVHIFDADKISGHILVDEATGGEKFLTLDNKEVNCCAGDVLIKDKVSGKILGLGGVKGALEGSITEGTKNIIVEMASFDNVSIRNTSRKHNLITDASQRFSQNIQYNLIENLLFRLINILEENTGGLKKISIIKSNNKIPGAKYTGVSVDEINNLLGTSYDEKYIYFLFRKMFIKHSVVDSKNVFIETLKKQVGIKYKYGASLLFDAPKAFDCSSLITYCAIRSGKSIPRISINQMFFSKEITKEELEVGDLIFLLNENSGAKIYRETLFENVFPITPGVFEKGVDHIVVYLGDNKILHAVGDTAENKVVIKNMEDIGEYEIVRYGRIFEKDEKRFVVEIPKERSDLIIGIDIIEEIARIDGYEKIPEAILNKEPKKNVDNFIKKLYKIIKTLNSIKFDEVFTYSFVNKGDIEVSHPIAKDKGSLRKNIGKMLLEVAQRNSYNSPLLGVDAIRIFEIGSVFTKNGEDINIAISVVQSAGGKKIDYKQEETIIKEAFKKEGVNVNISFNDDGLFESKLDYFITEEIKDFDYLEKLRNIKYRHYSQYPFIVRDISIFTPKNIKKEDIEKIIIENVGDYFIRLDHFDTFEKEDKISNTFRIVFQSQQKTLKDKEILIVMQKIEGEIEKNNLWEIR